jgi:hypothetical protein
VCTVGEGAPVVCREEKRGRKKRVAARGRETV